MCQFQQSRRRRTNRNRRIHIGVGSHLYVCVCTMPSMLALFLGALFFAFYLMIAHHMCTATDIVNNECVYAQRTLVVNERQTNWYWNQEKNNQKCFLFNKSFCDQFQYSNRTECFVAMAETCMTVSFGFVVFLWKILVAWRRWAIERVESVNLLNIWEFVKFTWI